MNHSINTSSTLRCDNNYNNRTVLSSDAKIEFDAKDCGNGPQSKRENGLHSEKKRPKKGFNFSENLRRKDL